MNRALVLVQDAARNIRAVMSPASSSDDRELQIVGAAVMLSDVLRELGDGQGSADLLAWALHTHRAWIQEPFPILQPPSQRTLQGVGPPLSPDLDYQALRLWLHLQGRDTDEAEAESPEKEDP